MSEKVFPCLLIPGRAEEAARFYCDLLPDSRISRTVSAPSDPPRLIALEFELGGVFHLALNAGPDSTPGFTTSLVIACDDQDEIDRYWSALGAGGTPGKCGWLTDRFGIVWQVVPRDLPALLADPARGARVFEAMIGMEKLNIAALRAA